MKEFKYLGVLFSSEGTMEREMGRRIGAAGSGTAVALPCEEKRAEPEGKALCLPGHFRSFMTERTRSWIQAAEMGFLRRVAGVSLRDKVRRDSELNRSSFASKGAS